VATEQEQTMRTIILAVVIGLGSLGVAAAEADSPVIGAWTATAGCRHGGGETLSLTITRDADGQLRGATNWALSSSDGRPGPVVSFTTVTAKGNTLAATTTANGRTIRLTATIDGDTISGGWLKDGDDDTWTFTGKRLATPAVNRPPR
jgi:hypothetical protein